MRGQGRTELYWLILSVFKRLKIKGRKEFRGDAIANISEVSTKRGAEPSIWGQEKVSGVDTEIWNHLKFLFWIVTISKLGLAPVRDMPSLLK